MKDECGKCRSTEYITHLTLRPIKVVVYERQSKLCQMAQMKFAAFVAPARGRVRLCGHGRAKERPLLHGNACIHRVDRADEKFICLFIYLSYSIF